VEVEAPAFAHRRPVGVQSLVVFFPALCREELMSTEGFRKCCQCEVWFQPHPRNAYHQRFCSKLECQATSKRASQQKWCRKNPGYFHGEAYVKKVQAWRRKHPGYWKPKGEAEACAPLDALQDLLTAQGFDHQGVKVFRNCLSEEIFQPLQDVLIAQQSALVGLAAMISGEALQEDIARVLTTCYERGQRIGGIVPWMQPQEIKHERTRADCAATAATGSPAIQLGRSPPGP
jgi:hypothetical protein